MDLQIGQVLAPNYQLGLVALSYAVAFGGSLLALLCAQHMFRSDGTLDGQMLVAAAVALGGIGIWSMHFIGMVAYELPVRVVYQAPLTAVSLVAAIAISAAALYLAGRSKSSGGFNWHGWLAGSVLAGLGVCVMHYLGMYAMDMRADITFNSGLVALSVVIAIVAAAVALWLAFHLTRFVQQVGAAAVMALAVCAMHYVGMSAATMICTAPSASSSALTFGGSYLGLIVFGISGAVLILIGWAVSGRLLDDTASPRAA